MRILSLRYVFRLTPEPGIIPVENPIRLGDVSAKIPLTVLFEFSIKDSSSQANEVSLLEGNLTMNNPSRSGKQEWIKIGMKCSVGNRYNDIPNPEINRALSSLSLYRIQEQVRQDLAHGEVTNASKHLHYLGSRLLALGHKELSDTAFIEAERIKQGNKLSDEGAKKIKYGTRSLLSTNGLENEDL